MKRNKWIWTICALLLGLFVMPEIVPMGLAVWAADGASAEIENNGSRLVAKTENIDAPVYQWMIADAADGSYTNIPDATEKYYDITAADEGKYIKVNVNGTVSEPVGPIGKLIVFDIAKGSVALGNTYSGKDKDGNTVSGTHTATNIYVVQQSDRETMTENKISFSGNLPNNPFDVTLNNLNMGDTPTNHNQAPGASGASTPTNGNIHIPATSSEAKKVTLRLNGENILRNITYYVGGDTTTPATNVKSSLKITNINGDGEVEGGSLYIPKKLSADEIEEFVNTKTNYNHWNAGIGGTDGSSLMQNFEIAGGRIQVVTTLGDNCSAIGAGGNGYCQMEISGGEVIAHCNGTGAAIGGGIGWNAAGGRADVLISGGNVYAQNHGNIQSGAEIVGGVAIGSGSSFYKDGTEGRVVITGGSVEAYGTFGNGIGGGNSSSSAGGKATVEITGGTVTASSIGGGNSRIGTGGSASVMINEPANVTLTGGIGGGDGYSGDGGAAEITIYGGTMNCGGVIGGGIGGGTGDGGAATVVVNAGTLTAASIGGGTGSTGGDGGAAEITINGGVIQTGSIGGGATLNPNGKIGYAKAYITGGDISGQFLMAAGGTEACSFVMTGGLLHNVNTVEETTYDYVQDNGAAVYMDDPNGTVTISGGTIEKCKAVNGGAVYMTAGTFTLSGTGTIQNCEATETGGAVYLGGGTMKVNSGTINNNKAAANGGAAYINGGDFIITGGSIDNNQAQINGGGVAVNNGNYRMVGGEVNNNQANEGNGGGIYVSSDDTQAVKVDVLSGYINNNIAQISGGALAVVGKEEGSKAISVTVGVNELHYKEYEEEGEIKLREITCDHDSVYDDITNEVVEACPVIKNNRAQISGGAILVKGNENAILNVFCLEESENAAVQENELSDCMKVEGGKVLISTTASNNQNYDTQDSLNGNINITGTIYVTGGQIDIWGDMTNPRTIGFITVDIDKNDDYFLDHRKIKDFYKLLYYENFTDPLTNSTTGQYKQKNIPINGTETILGNIYSHPGYDIKGWNTDKDAAHNWPQGKDPDAAEGTTTDRGWYEINKAYTFNGNPIGDLTIYAIWTANGYTVIFDPNVPDGETYSGTMGNLNYTYDLPVELPLNEYKRAGYIFKGWTKDREGTGELYTDGQSVVNLTTQKGEVVTLYAKWETCDHDPTNHEYTYSVIDEGKTLKRTCSCEGYSETVALYAENTVYDQFEHPAEVTYSSASWNPSVSYTKKDGNDFVEHAAVPENAGTYMASVTEGGKTASVTYVIEKADQPVPNKPEYDAIITDTDTEKKSELKIKHVNDSVYKSDPSYDCVKQYKIVYYDGTTKIETEWISGPADENTDYAVTYELDRALTNYVVYARYSDGTNYKASLEVAAESVYFFTGDVKLFVYPGEGVTNVATEASGDDVAGESNGILLKVTALEGYYLPDEYFTGINEIIKGVQIVTTKKDQPDAKHDTQAQIRMLETGTALEEQYHIGNIPESCEIHVTLPDAKKISKASAKITEKQVFEAVTKTSAVISRDSAYTVFFEVLNYDTASYSNLNLSFSKELPVGTNLILLDKESGMYYWKEIDSATDTLDLSVFTQMGTQNTKFSIEKQKIVDDTGKYQYTDLKLQLVVDFSEVSNESLLALDEPAELETKLIAVKTKTENTRIPECSITEKAELKNKHVYSMETVMGTTESDNNTMLNLSLIPSEGIASKWDNRQTALILIPDDNTALPVDARISYKVGNNTTVAYANANGEYIIPLQDPTSSVVDITLISSLFTDVNSYSFSAKWIVAYSIAEQSPLNGDVVGFIDSVMISSSKKDLPSVKIETQKMLYDETDRITVDGKAVLNVIATVNWAGIVEGHEMNVTLMIKNENGTYTSTGVTQKVEGTGATSANISITVPDNVLTTQYDSYCLNIAVDQGLVRLTEANCYFIVEK